MNTMTTSAELRRVEFCRRAERLLGAQWRARFATGSGVTYANVKRWAYGGAPIPAWAVAMLDLVELLHARSIPLPAEWEPTAAARTETP